MVGPVQAIRESSSQNDIVSDIPSAKDVVDRMNASIASTPVLHVTVINLHRGVEYHCQGWMMGLKSRSEVRKDGRLIFARYTDRKRIQEYVPKASFVNKMEAEHVLVEYDADGPSGDWPRLMENTFSCGPAIIASDYYLPVPNHRSYPDIWLGNMETSRVSKVTFRSRSCLWYHTDVTIEGDTLTWDLYVDIETFKPLRLSGLVVAADGTHKKEDVYEYTFEHLQTDEGINWRLDPAQFMD